MGEDGGGGDLPALPALVGETAPVTEGGEGEVAGGEGVGEVGGVPVVEGEVEEVVGGEVGEAVGDLTVHLPLLHTPAPALPQPAHYPQSPLLLMGAEGGDAGGL